MSSIKIFPEEKSDTMVRKGKQVARKRKAEMPEEDEKQNELILEEVLNISGKNVEKDEGSPPAKMKKSNEVTTPSKKVITKKRSASPSTSSNSKPKKSTSKEDNTVNEVKASTSERGDPVPNLPDGWRKQLVVRKSGKSAGQIDIYFYSPDGVKLRSRPDVAAYLKKHKSSIKIEEFDFSRVAKTSEAIVKKKPAESNAMAKKKSKTVLEEKPEVEEESKDLAKNQTSVSKSADVPPSNAEGEEQDTEAKTKAVPDVRNAEDKQDKKNDLSTSRKPKDQKVEEIKSKVLSSQVADEASTTRMMRANQSNKMKPPKLEKKSADQSNETQSLKPKLDIKKKRTDQSKEMKSSKPKMDIKKKSSDTEPHANGDVKNFEKGKPDPKLGKGWRKHMVVRKSGNRAGKVDTYYYSPEGIKLRSRPDAVSYLKKHKSNLKLEQFDFHATVKSEDVVESATSSQKTAVPKKKEISQGKSKVGAKTKKSDSMSKSAKVPPSPSEEFNDNEDSDKKPSKVLVQILPSKPKKLRK